MNPIEIEILAKQDGVLTKSELEEKLIELQSLNWRILECIIYVRFNQGCSLNDAKNIIVNSSAWIDEKEDFMKQQEEMHQEFLAFSMETATEIEMVVTPEGATYRIKKQTFI